MGKSRETSSPARKANRAKSYATGQARKAVRVAAQEERAKVNKTRGYTDRELRRAIAYFAGAAAYVSAEGHDKHVDVRKSAIAQGEWPAETVAA